MPSVTDLTDLETCRTFLQKQDVSTDQDDVIELLITAASRAIVNYTQREFIDSGAGDTRRFLVSQSDGILDLAPYDLRADQIYNLVLDPQDAGGTQLAEYDAFIFKPQPARDGVYMYASLQEPLQAVANWRRGDQRVVAITGTWGFEAVPADVQHWTNVVVATWLRKDIAAFTNVFNIDTGQIERAFALPGGAIAGLAGYCRDI